MLSTVTVVQLSLVSHPGCKYVDPFPGLSEWCRHMLNGLMNECMNAHVSE